MIGKKYRAKNYVSGILLALLWWGLILAAIYGVATLAPKPWNMRNFILLMLGAWPLLAGFLAGWQEGKLHGGNGFLPALAWMLPSLALLGALWWWILPQLWQGGAYGKFVLYGVVAALFSGGLGAGLAKARQILYPPRPDDVDDEDTDDEEN